MKRKLDNSMCPIAENSVASMPPSSNCELFERYPDLNPSCRTVPARILVRRAKSCATRGVPTKGEQCIQILVLAPDNQFKIHTNTISESVAIEYLKAAVQTFKPESVDFSHYNGSLAVMQSLYEP